MSNPGTFPVYFSIDSSQDLSAGVLRLGVDKVSFPATATFVPSGSVPADIAALRPTVDPNKTRYTWQFLCGAGTQIALADGLSTVYGRLTLGSSVLPGVWRVSTPATISA